MCASDALVIRVDWMFIERKRAQSIKQDIPGEYENISYLFFVVD